VCVARILAVRVCCPQPCGSWSSTARSTNYLFNSFLELLTYNHFVSLARTWTQERKKENELAELHLKTKYTDSVNPSLWGCNQIKIRQPEAAIKSKYDNGCNQIKIRQTLVLHNLPVLIHIPATTYVTEVLEARFQETRLSRNSKLDFKKPDYRDKNLFSRQESLFSLANTR